MTVFYGRTGVTGARASGSMTLSQTCARSVGAVSVAPSCNPTHTYSYSHFSPPHFSVLRPSSRVSPRGIGAVNARGENKLHLPNREIPEFKNGLVQGGLASSDGRCSTRHVLFCFVTYAPSCAPCHLTFLPMETEQPRTRMNFSLADQPKLAKWPEGSRSRRRGIDQRNGE